MYSSYNINIFYIHQLLCRRIIYTSIDIVILCIQVIMLLIHTNQLYRFYIMYTSYNVIILCIPVMILLNDIYTS